MQNVTFVGIDFQGKLIENDGQKLMVAQEQAGLLKRWANLHGVMGRLPEAHWRILQLAKKEL